MASTSCHANITSCTTHIEAVAMPLLALHCEVILLQALVCACIGAFDYFGREQNMPQNTIIVTEAGFGVVSDCQKLTDILFYGQYFPDSMRNYDASLCKKRCFQDPM